MSKNTQKLWKNPLLYAVLFDVLCCVLCVVICFVCAEAFLPGFVTTAVSPLILFTVFYAVVCAVTLIASRQNTSYTPKKKKTFLVLASTLFFAGCVALAGFRYDMIFNVVSVAGCIIIFILLYNTLRAKITS